MARSQTAAAPAATKTHRPTGRVTKSSPRAVAKFNPAEHHHEIALAAYHCWLERGDTPGSPEQDWMRAEAQVRSRYS
jgi:hypothetical protein